MAQTKNCPACGAPLTIENRFAKLITCEFCDHVILIHDKGLDPTGQTSKLAEMPSMLFVGAVGTLEGKEFEVKGRLRYQSQSAYWDEWFLIFDASEQPGWLVEDEGTFKFYNKRTLTGTVPPFEEVSVGSTVSVAGKQVFISEKGTAQIAGSEGQIAFRIMPGEQINYLDGNHGSEMFSVEYAKNEIDYSIGRPIERSDIIVEEEDYW
jgi:hypothetical protein